MNKYISNKTNGKLSDIIGCSYETFKSHIESLWKSGMNWENWGKGPNKWNIDHIRPCAAYDLTVLEEQKKCFHYTNLQPLWQHENASKSDYMQILGKRIRARNLRKATKIFSSYHNILTINKRLDTEYRTIDFRVIDKNKENSGVFVRLYQLPSGIVVCDSVGIPKNCFISKEEFYLWIESKAKTIEGLNLLQNYGTQNIL